jgi:hypothetical protein
MGHIPVSGMSIDEHADSVRSGPLSLTGINREPTDVLIHRNEAGSGTEYRFCTNARREDRNHGVQDNPDDHRAGNRLAKRS